MALFHELIKQKSRMGYNEFWDSVYGSYSQINDIDKKCLNPVSLRMIQLGIIKKQMQTNVRLKQANDFVQKLSMYNISDTETMATNAIFSRIATILNSPFKSGDIATREASDRVGELNRLLQTVNINIPIPNTVIQALSQNITLTKGSGLYDYRAEKSKLFEEIAAAYFSGSGLGVGITTGSWGKISDNNRQLATDVYAFLHKDGVPSMRGKYTKYEKTGHWALDNKRASSGLSVSVSSDLNTFIQEMEKLNGQMNIGISIDDELADTLDIVSSLRIQVKSGINQSILNTNYRNAIQLSEFADSRLNLLLDLYYQDQKQSFLYFYKNPKDSKSLTAYANYLLSTNIAKTSLTKNNNIYFTEHGFETVYDWMKNRNVYLRFQRNIKMNAQLLSQNRKYGFNAI